MWGQALVPLLSPLFQQRRYRKGEIMAKQGAPATTLFYIQSGECEVLHRLDLEGDEDFEDEVSRCRGGACWQLAGWEAGVRRHPVVGPSCLGGVVPGNKGRQGWGPGCCGAARPADALGCS